MMVSLRDKLFNLHDVGFLTFQELVLTGTKTELVNQLRGVGPGF